MGLACLAAPAAAQQCEPGILPFAGNLTANGPAFASARWDPDGDGPRPSLLVIAGGFDHVGNGAVAGSTAAFDPATRRWTHDFEGSAGLVRALLTTDDGSLYAAGEFIDPVSGSIAYVAKWSGRAWSPVGNGPEGQVWALAEAADGDIIAGGTFEAAAGQPALNVARWDGAGWTAMGDGLNDTVRALAWTLDGRLYAGGDFDQSGLDRVGHLAEWTGTRWQSTPLPVSNGPVLSLAPMDDGSLAVGGSFSSINNVPFPRIARLSDDQWITMGSFQGPVTSLRRESDGIYAVGMYSSSSPAARWNGTAWQAVNAGTSTCTLAVRLSDEEFILSGNYYTAGNPYSYLRVVSSAAPRTTNGTIWNAVRDGQGGCIVSGTFTTIGGVQANRIARWNGVSFTPLGPGLPNVPVALYVLRNGDVLAAGGTPTIQGGFGHIARWDGDTWTFTTFPQSGWIYAFTELPTGEIVVGGSISSNTPWIRGVAQWDGATLTPIGEGLDTQVRILQTGLDGRPIAGGGITDSIRQWSGTYWRAFAEGLHNTQTGYPGVNEIEILPNGDVLAVGIFNNAGDEPINALARWDGTDWYPVAPREFTDGLSDLELLADGSFVGRCGLSSQNRAIRQWDGVQTRTLVNDATTVYNSKGILELNNEIILFGNFGAYRRSEAENFARYAFSNTPWTAIHPQPVVAPEGQTVVLTATPATGYEAVQVRWQRNGQDIHDGVGGAAPGGGEVLGAARDLEPVTNGTPVMLVIFNAQPADGGQYTAVFSTTCGLNTSHSAAVTINPDCPPCAADFDSSGGVTGDDLGAFIAAYEQGLHCADVNFDGGVGLDDLVAFIAAYEAGGC